MKVELRKHVGRNVATGKEETLSQYRVFVDDRPAGFIGWHDDAELLLTTRFGPIEQQKISDLVSKELGRVCDSKQAPDVPEEMLKPPREEINFDDFADEG